MLTADLSWSYPKNLLYTRNSYDEHEMFYRFSLEVQIRSAIVPYHEIMKS